LGVVESAFQSAIIQQKLGQPRSASADQQVAHLPLEFLDALVGVLAHLGVECRQSGHNRFVNQLRRVGST
jgi:hypothetical protein